jgi:hypothetical protein
VPLEFGATGVIWGEWMAFAVWLCCGNHRLVSRVFATGAAIASLVAATAFGHRCIGPHDVIARTCGALIILLGAAVVCLAGAAITRLVLYRIPRDATTRRLVPRTRIVLRLGLLGLVATVAANQAAQFIALDQLISSQVVGGALVYLAVPMVLASVPLSPWKKWMLAAAFFGGIAAVGWTYNTIDFPLAWAWLAGHAGFSAGYLSALAAVSVCLPIDHSAAAQQADPAASRIRLIPRALGLALAGSILAGSAWLHMTFNIEMGLAGQNAAGGGDWTIARLFNGWQLQPGAHPRYPHASFNGLSLPLADYDLDQGDVEALRQLSSIDALSFRNQNQLYLEIFQIPGLQGVRSLTIHGLRFDEVFVASLASFNRLNELHVREARIAPQDAILLRQIPNLFSLGAASDVALGPVLAEIPNTSIRVLDLSRTSATTAALEPLKNAVQLRILHLADTEIGPEIVPFLNHSNGLRAVELSRTKVPLRALIDVTKPLYIVKADAPLSAVAKVSARSKVILVAGNSIVKTPLEQIDFWTRRAIGTRARLPSNREWLEEFAVAVRTDSDGEITGIDLTDVPLNIDDLHWLSRLPRLRELAISPDRIEHLPIAAIPTFSPVGGSKSDSWHKFSALERVRISCGCGLDGSISSYGYQLAAALIECPRVSELQVIADERYGPTGNPTSADLIPAQGNVRRFSFRDETGWVDWSRFPNADFPKLAAIKITSAMPLKTWTETTLRERLEAAAESVTIQHEPDWQPFLPEELYELK